MKKLLGIVVLGILGMGFLIFLISMGAFSSPLGFLGAIATTAIVWVLIQEMREK